MGSSNHFCRLPRPETWAGVNGRARFIDQRRRQLAGLSMTFRGEAGLRATAGQPVPDVPVRRVTSKQDGRRQFFLPVVSEI